MGGMNIVRGRRDKQREREDGGRKGEKSAANSTCHLFRGVRIYQILPLRNILLLPIKTYY